MARHWCALLHSSFIWDAASVTRFCGFQPSIFFFFCDLRFFFVQALLLSQFSQFCFFFLVGGKKQLIFDADYIPYARVFNTMNQ